MDNAVLRPRRQNPQGFQKLNQTVLLMRREFEPDSKVGLFDMAGMELELTEKLGRKVDLRTAGDLSRYFRELVATEAIQYARIPAGLVE